MPRSRCSASRAPSRAFPAGSTRSVANRGLTLSSGQRQLVALARTFLADPAVVVLDEATSNLDPATDALVEHALTSLLDARTAIVIAHRVGTALRADRVIVLEHGRAVEHGPPDELAAHDGAFARWVAAARAGNIRVRRAGAGGTMAAWT